MASFFSLFYKSRVPEFDLDLYGTIFDKTLLISDWILDCL